MIQTSHWMDRLLLSGLYVTGVCPPVTQTLLGNMMLMSLKCCYVRSLSHCPFEVDDFIGEMGFDNMVLGPLLNTDMS